MQSFSIILLSICRVFSKSPASLKKHFILLNRQPKFPDNCPRLHFPFSSSRTCWIASSASPPPRPRSPSSNRSPSPSPCWTSCARSSCSSVARRRPGCTWRRRCAHSRGPSRTRSRPWVRETWEPDEEGASNGRFFPEETASFLSQGQTNISILWSRSSKQILWHIVPVKRLYFLATVKVLEVKFSSLQNVPKFAYE